MFANRNDAGRLLARALSGYCGDDALLLGLPRGGVATAAAVAEQLEHSFDVFMVKKLASPLSPEFAIGALAEEGTTYIDHRQMLRMGIDEEELSDIIEAARREVRRRAVLYRAGRPLPSVKDRTVILVDDGIATGATMRAAVLAMRKYGAQRVIVATPVCSVEARQMLRSLADAIVSIETPWDMISVGSHYEEFGQLDDAEVIRLLGRSRSAGTRLIGSVTESIMIRDGLDLPLPADLSVPHGAMSLVVFVHGSGSGRRSPRNTFVAEAFRRAGFATLLFDLMTEGESEYYAHAFDIDFLARRLEAVLEWVTTRADIRDLPLSLYGSSTGAAAALVVAARNSRVRAVISRGGRIDLVRESLPQLRLPVLLIVGGADNYVSGLNRSSRVAMRCPNDLIVIPGATHLFSEPGALDQVASESVSWLTRQALTSGSAVSTHA